MRPRVEALVFRVQGFVNPLNPFREYGSGIRFQGCLPKGF